MRAKNFTLINDVEKIKYGKEVFNYDERNADESTYVCMSCRKMSLALANRIK